MENFTQTMSLPIMAVALLCLIGLVWWVNVETPPPVEQAAPPRKRAPRVKEPAPPDEDLVPEDGVEEQVITLDLAARP